MDRRRASGRLQFILGRGSDRNPPSAGQSWVEAAWDARTPIRSAGGIGTVPFRPLCVFEWYNPVVTRPVDKLLERRVVETLEERLRLGVVHIEEREAPDYLLHLGDGAQVGLEVVEVTDPKVASGMAGLRRLKESLQAE